MKYVFDRRDFYDINWAIGPNATLDFYEAVKNASDQALRTGETHYVHRLSTSRGRWVLMLKISPVKT
mgnify:FL=1